MFLYLLTGLIYEQNPSNLENRTGIKDIYCPLWWQFIVLISIAIIVSIIDYMLIITCSFHYLAMLAITWDILVFPGDKYLELLINELYASPFTPFYWKVGS